MIDTIKPYLPLIIPIFTIPVIMRLVIAPIIHARLKKKYIRNMTSTIKEGWVDDKDLEAIEYLKIRAWKGLSNPFVISYNSSFLIEQVKSIFIDISQIYNKSDSNSIDLKFSVQKILEALYLIFEDVHKELKQMKLYSVLEKLPLSSFLRVKRVNSSIRVITQNKIIRVLNKYRITVKVLRLLLVPILGLPIILFQLLFSLLYTTIFEGYLRFIYGIILIKTGYYTIYLYSNRNSSLHKRLKFSHKDIIKRGEVIESRHTNFNNRFSYSKNLEKALLTLKSELEKENILPDKEISSNKERISRIITRLSNTIKNSIKSELSPETSRNYNFSSLITISKKIGRVYYPKSVEPIFQLRVKEFLEFGYFLTNVSLKTVYTIPGSSRFLDKVPVELIVNISDYIEEKDIKKTLPHIRKGGRILNNIQSYYWTSRVLLKKSHPMVFAATLITPLIYQQVQDSLKEYVFNMGGLLLIDSYESTMLKSNKCRIKNVLDN